MPRPPRPATSPGGGAPLPKLGQGRSAEVFLDRDADGRPVVRKIFTGDAASKAVLFLLTGSANPYTWCEAAIRAAVHRRHILARLVACWFDGKLRLPRTDGWAWSEDHLAFELRTELIDGRHAPLRGPGNAHGVDEVRDLYYDVMKPLQRRLAAAGFDGLVWQAGRGNPVAANNFMLERSNADAPRWAWIDLESGVPAMFAMNPLATLGFYLPKSIRHRRWLFDDVDVGALRRYLAERREEIERAVGPRAFAETLGHVDELERRQEEWKSIPRHRRGIAYELSRQRITAAQAERYAARPLRWYARMLGVGTARAASRGMALARRGLARLAGLDLGRLTAAAWRFCVSQRFRAHLARRYVGSRIRAWRARRFLDRDGVRRLGAQLRHDEVSAYLTDFVVHLMIKPPIKFLQWFVVPLALAVGAIDVVTAAILLVAGGLIGRTLYTVGRSIQAASRGHRPPWIALGIGLLPVVGNTAYPAQLLYCSTAENGDLARFILYDSLASIGRAVPIWGGADSLTEHLFNRLGDVAVRWLKKPIA